MSKKYFLLTIVFIGTPLSAADKLKPNKLKPTPPATPPIHNSPVPTKKEHNSPPLFEIPAANVEIRTSTGTVQNLEVYLHHNLHRIYEEITNLQQQTSDLHAKIDVQTSTLNDALQNHDQYITKQLHDVTMQQTTPILVNFTNIDGDTEEKPLNYAIEHLQQRNEQCWTEIKGVKDAHNERLKTLEESQKYTAAAAEHKSWSRWLMDHFVASALVATGLYHSSALNSIITHTVPALLHSTVTKVLPYLPYAGIPASILFAGALATDIHHNLQETTFNNHRSDWKTYCQSQKWSPIKQPSDFFVSTAVITKAFTDNVSHVIKPACKLMVGISIVQLMLGAGATSTLSTIPRIS